MQDLRRTGGRETWHRLREWDKAQVESERLAARLLPMEGFTGIDPCHPLGGPDGGKDVVCKRDGNTWIVAVFFPRGQQTEGAIRSKFREDLSKIKALGVDGMLFVTNQEI